MSASAFQLRPADERGTAEHGWLSSRFSFSFADYHDPDYMGFRSLRVINDDIIQGGQGFGTHPHRDMEILSVVVDGALEHRDSLDNGSVIRPGEVQRMTAGTGIMHSEFNPLPDRPMRLLQIWIQPEARDLEPGYEQRLYNFEANRNSLILIASRDGRGGSVVIHQDVSVSRGLVDQDAEIEHPLACGRHAWLQLIDGNATVNGRSMGQGDGAAVSGAELLRIQGGDGGGDLLVFDLA